MSARHPSRAGTGWALLTAAVAAGASAFALSCGEEHHPGLVGGIDPSRPGIGDSCATAAEGCACSTEGASVACGETESVAGDEVVCLEGERTCVSGRWSACSAERRTKKYVPGSSGSRWLALADAGAPCMNKCDPSCTQFVDSVTGIDAGPGLTVTDGGLTLPTSDSDVACATVVISPAAPTITVTQFEPTLQTSPANIAFTATCGVNGRQIYPTWTLRPADADVARIDPDGVLSVQVGVAKTIQVTATSAASSASVPVQVRVAVNTVDPACESAVSVFDAAATGGADPGHTLYPYAVPARPVVFPLGLSAPLVQWATGGTRADCVKVSLRYPAGAAEPSFSWSRILAGTGGNDPTQGKVDTSQPAANLDQTAWSAFDRSARGNVGEILVQRRPAATPNSVREPMTIPVRFASDALRGTVYYTRYTRKLRDDANSATNRVCGSAANGAQNDIDIGSAAFRTSAANGCLGGNCDGPGPVCPVGTCTQVNEDRASLVQALDLSRPGATPVDPFSGGSAKCPVCHSVSADGSTFVADTFAGAGVPSIASIGSDNGVPEFESIADAPAYSWVANRDEARGSPQREQSWGFGYAAISPDGRYTLAGPNFWGSTDYNVTLGNGNQQDAGYPAGGKRYFLIDVRGFLPNVDFATTEPLPPHRVNGKWITGNQDGDLEVDGYELAQFHEILVKDEPIASQNGIYKVEDPGSFNRPFVLERVAHADEPGELAFGQKVLVEDGDSNIGKYFHVATPTAGNINPGSTALGFAMYSTVMAATSGPLPSYVRSTTGSGVTVLTGTGALPATAIDDVPVADRMSILVWNESGANARYNGIYSLRTGTNWTLTRRAEADSDVELQGHPRVRVNQGTRHGGRTFVLTNNDDVDLDNDALTFQVDTLLDEGVKLDRGGTPSTLPTMMYPVFAPDGRSLVYVNGDSDPIAGNETGWRRGLSLLSFDPNNPATPFSNPRRVLNTYAAGSPGMVMKWPFFEPDSRSVVFVETSPNEFCPVEAYGGLCNGANCDSKAGSVSIDTDIERACFQASNAMGHGNGAPTHRGFWPGRLNSVNTQSAEKAELAFLNAGLGSQDAALSPDSGKAYQPTVLPFAAGGYRWVIFTSTRAYGNQMNPLGTHFSCGASLLWMAALDDGPAGTADRSHPAFLVPGQDIRSIVSSSSSRHYINERGYLVPSPCKPVSSVCTVNEECCGAGGATPTTECRLDPDADPPQRTCESVTDCVRQGDSCTTSRECCSGVPCVQGVCAPAPVHRASSFQRVFVGSCPSGYLVRWGTFEWHAEAPSSSHVYFSAQASDSEDFSASKLVPFAEANSGNINRPNTPYRTANVGAALDAAEAPSGAYLRVTMDLQPSVDKSVAPVVYDWRQRFDCVAAE
ncbi:MAG TPA: hypothetical protein VG937_32595 [Polyangiaceae bacterium]|nr:hypothetical protein [Polyangiaceae bacterium]